MKGISVIRTMDRLRIVKGILGWTGMIRHFGLDLVHFRRIWTIRSRRLRSVTNCFRMRFWPIHLCRFMRKCLCWHCRFSRMRGRLWFPVLSISLFDGLWTGWFVRTNGWTRTRSRYFPGQYVIRRFIMVLEIWNFRMETRNGSACCIPPVREVWIMEPWRLDWTAKAWIIGEESSGTLGSWVNNAYMGVMIASV